MGPFEEIQIHLLISSHCLRGRESQPGDLLLLVVRDAPLPGHICDREINFYLEVPTGDW